MTSHPLAIPGSSSYTSQPFAYPPLSQPLTKGKIDDNTFEELEERINSLVSSKKATYEKLQDLRAAKKDLKRFERKNGILNEAVFPLYDRLKTKELELLKTEDVFKAVVLEKGVARWKGKKIRNERVTPNQIFKLLEEHIPVNPETLWKIVQVFCRQINEIMENPELYKGKCLQLKAEEKTYPFCFHLKPDEVKDPFCFKKSIELLGLKFMCWYELSKDKKEISLFIVPDKKNIAANASYKRVFNANRVTIPLSVKARSEEKTESPVYERSGKVVPMVLIEPLGPTERAAVKKGISLQQQLKLLAPNAEVVSVPLEPPPLVGGTIRASPFGQFCQDWYNGDLHDALGSLKVPLGFRTKDALPFSMKEILKCIKDAGQAISHWHKVGYAHRDIKAPNILLEVSKDEQTIKGLPADFDLVQKFGFGFTDQYVCWDTTSCRGLVTPFVDVYGLAMILGTSFLAGFNMKTPSLIHSDAYKTYYIAKAIEQNSDFKFSDLISSEMPTKTKDVIVADWVKNTQSLIEKHSLNPGVEPKNYQDLQKKIKATKQIISLVEDVVSINESLCSFYINEYPLLRKIAQKKCNSQNDNYVLFLKELCSLWVSKPIYRDKIYPKSNQLVRAKNCLSPLRKLINIELSRSTYDKDELNAMLSQIEARQQALSFARRMELLKPDEQMNHPLYSLLQESMNIDLNKFDDYLQDEIDTFKPSADLLSHIQKDIRPFTDTADKRKALIEVLDKIVLNRKKSKVLREEAFSLKKQIIDLKLVWAYLVEIKNSFDKAVVDVMRQAMSMDTFISRLTAIMDTLA